MRLLIINVLLLFALASTAMAMEMPVIQKENILYTKNSLYQYLVVSENPKTKQRFLFNNKKALRQGGIYTEAPGKLLFEYTRMSFVSLAFLEREPQSALFIGLGVGAMPRYFNRLYPDAEVDIVEIDPDVVDIAKKYFYFSVNDKMRVHVSDGRTFIRRNPKKYDIVFLDAYQGGHIPFHLTTVEFLREVKKRLNPGGVVVSNVLARHKNKFFTAMVKTFNTEFTHLYTFKGPESSNQIFVAEMRDGLRTLNEITEAARAVRERNKMDVYIDSLAFFYRHRDKGKSRGKLLTDDFAPVNLLREMREGS